MKKLIVLVILALNIFSTRAQCTLGKKQVSITIVTDNYGSETSWTLKNNLGQTIATSPTYISNDSVVTNVCVDTTACLTFTIYDQYGDGMCCVYGNGSYTVKYKGAIVVSGGTFTTKEATTFNCGPGTSCNTANVIGKGTFTAPTRETWYSYTPDSAGVYKISTCGLGNTCDTKIWVYEGLCSTLNITQNNTGTILYDDDAGGCGLLAVVSGYLEKGKTYYIRIGATSACTGSIDFTLSYNGPLKGCTDPASCTYNPLAVIDDGSCLYFPNPLCQAPDLTIVEAEVKSSMYLDTFDADADQCTVVEGCVNGYGIRKVLRFDSYIKNIGNLDYFIGDPGTNPSQFSENNCHGHAHYEGYAEYVLYKPNGDNTPIGFKNGFCVLDYDGCVDGGTAKYSCNNMGISKQCGDIYHAALDCQWIDITDIAAGNYTLAVKVNWDQSPDALGHYESSYVNNWAQVCIIIYDSLGVRYYKQDPSCTPYLDCAGVQYGHAVKDCNGNCNGTVKMGDLDNNTQQQLVDAQLYVDKILNSTITPTKCNDLNNDSLITVWDAALLNNCVKNGTPSNIKCQFPHRLTNPNQTVTLSIGAINVSQNYFEINIKNPSSGVLAYEFDMTGLTILNVQNLIPAVDYPVAPSYVAGVNKVISISYLDSSISKYNTPTPLCRIYYSALTGGLVCIDKIVHIINKQYESVKTQISNGCVVLTGINALETIDSDNYFIVYPNPSNGNATIQPYFKDADVADLTLTNIVGEKILEKTSTQISNGQPISIDLTSVCAGTYFVTLKTKEASYTRMLLVHD